MAFSARSFAIFLPGRNCKLNPNIFDSLEASPVDMIFLFHSHILTVKERVEAAHNAEKTLFIHIDLSEGIARDRAGVSFLSQIGVDGVISTKPSLLRFAKEIGLVTVQRFFVYDSQGVAGIEEVLASSSPDIIEILPGVIGKITSRFAREVSVPLIAGGLIETKAEVMEALQSGAIAVSTGKEELWYQ